MSQGNEMRGYAISEMRAPMAALPCQIISIPQGWLVVADVLDDGTAGMRECEHLETCLRVP